VLLNRDLIVGQTDKFTNPERNDELRDMLRQAEFYIFASQIRIRQLERDVESVCAIDRTTPKPQQRSSAATAARGSPASLEILRSTVSVLGRRLFSLPWFLLLDSMAEIGVTAAAEVFALLDGEGEHAVWEIQQLKAAFLSVSERYPGEFMAAAKEALEPYTRNRLGNG
jgi:hypothetical protein